MRGDLVEKTAADVCRDLAASEASGVLAIEGPDGPARVVFAAGRIIAAVSPAPRARLGDRLVGAGELDPDDLARALRSQDESGQNPRLGALLVEQGLVRPDAVRVFVQEQVLDALFEIIRWRYGAFAFTADDGSGPTGIPLSLTVDDALVEVARRQQEWQQLSRVIPDLEAIPNFRQGAATASASLEPDEFAVLASVDGERSIRSLAADLGYGEFEAARIVYGLSLLGIVDVRLPQDAIGAALEDALALGPADRGDAAPAADDAQAADDPQPADADVQATDDEGSWAQVHDIGSSAEPDVWVSPPDDDMASDADGPDSDHPAPDRDQPTPDGDVAVPPPPPAASADMPDFFTTGPSHPSVADDDAQHDGDDADDTTLDITFEVPDPTPDRSRSERERSERERSDASPAEAFAEIYADDDRDTGSRPGAAGDGPGDAPDDASGTSDDASDDPSDPPPGDDPGRRDGTSSAPQRGDDNDVSEFLRELSRLSLDPPTTETSARPKPPKPEPPAPSQGQDSGKKKRRGLFGRG